MTHKRVGVNIIMSRTIPGTLAATWGEGQRCKKMVMAEGGGADKNFYDE